MENSPLFSETLFAPGKNPEDQSRLVRASGPVFFVIALLFASRIISDPSSLDASLFQSEEEKKLESRIYPVLVEQADRPEVEKDEMRALSDVSAAGKGGLTEKEGFHTLTPYDTLEPGRQGKKGGGGSPGESGRPAPDGAYLAKAEKKKEEKPEPDGILLSQKRPSRTDTDTKKPAQAAKKTGQQGNRGAGQGEEVEEQDFRIPANYRFRRDFVFRYDQSSRLSVARQELIGFRYFQSMLRQIQDNFAPPGYNYAYRDFAGTVISQPIKPQTVRVMFSLDFDGLVRDVRVVSSMGQPAVDQACKNALKDQNFGPPPQEIFQGGHIFGIDFVFPASFN